jgi:hypothetical protein
LANHIEQNADIDESIRDALLAFQHRANQPWSVFVRRIRDSSSGNPNNWGDSTTLYLLSKFLNMRITICQFNVYMKTNERRQTTYYLPHFQKVDDGTPCIYLLLDNEHHFQTLLPVEGKYIELTTIFSYIL